MRPAPWLDRDAWPYAPRSFAHSEGSMHYVQEGEGAPVLFSHGTPTWAFEWRHLIRGLLPQASAIAVDHLGFGLSDRPQGAGYRPEDHAARFRAFADHLDLRNITLVVHDYGGPIALDWALDHLDRIRRVVVLNTWAWPLNDVPAIARPARVLSSGFGRWMYGQLNLSLRMLAPSAWADKRLWTASKGQYLPVFPDYASRTEVLWPLSKALLASSEFYGRLQQRLRRLAEVPVDVVWGVDDPAFPTAFRDRWVDEVPHAAVHNVQPAGHWPHEEAPDAVLEIVRTGLQAS